MICPHCKKAIPYHRPMSTNLSDADRKMIKKLRDDGYSCRDIEFYFDRRLSYSSVKRVLEEMAKK